MDNVLTRLSNSDRSRLLDEQYQQLRNRLAKHVAQGTSDLGPTIGKVAPDFYTDPVRWEAEKREIFLRVPLLACLSRDIPNPGDMVVFDAAGPSILVVRNKNGGVSAFLNACMHRVATLVTECRSNRKIITCPFHGWTYDLEGKLRGVPSEEAFDKADLAERDLVRVPVREWAGMVFVKAQGGEASIALEELDEFLGDFAAPLAAFQLDLADPVGMERIEIPGNWKYALNTYHEIYHADYLHRDLIAGMFTGATFTNTRYGRHHEYNFPGQKFPPAEGASLPAGEEIVGKFPRDLAMFPSTFIGRLAVTPTEYMIRLDRIFPGDTMNAGFVLAATYKAGSPIASEEEREMFTQAHQFYSKIIVDDDFRVVENSSNNLRYMPEGFKLLFGRNEGIVQEMQKELARAAGMPLPD